MVETIWRRYWQRNKCSGKLYEVTETLKHPVIEEEKVKKFYGEILMSAKTPKKDGKGYKYPALELMVELEETVRGDRAGSCL